MFLCPCAIFSLACREREPSAVFQGSFLCAALSLQYFSLQTLVTLRLPQTPKSISPTWGDQQTQPGSFLPATQSGNSLRAVIWGNCRAHCMHFLSLRDHCPLSSKVLCLQNHCFICSVQFFSCFYKRVNIVPVIPSWLEAAIFPRSFYKCIFLGLTVYINQGYVLVDVYFQNYPLNLLTVLACEVNFCLVSI